MIKKGVFTLALLFFIAVPQLVNAQTISDDVYRAYLLRIIELLQQQIILLTENSEDSFTTATENEFDSFLIDSEDAIVAWYQLKQAGSVAGIKNETHREYLARFFELVPNEYDTYFKEFLIYNDRRYEFDGFVETVSPYQDDTWRLGLNNELIEFNSDPITLDDLFVHEFAHVISYQAIPGRTAPRNATCHEHFAELGCPPMNSYLMDFVDEFWTEDMLDRLVVNKNRVSLWTKQELRENFVSDYAATDPAEDFAESFTFFVLEERVTGESISEEKTNYFYNFPKMVELRNQIVSVL